MRRLRSSTLVRALVTLLAGCAPESGDEACEDGTAVSSLQALTGAARRPRALVIRDVAAASGLTNGALLGGIAEVESGLSHCWSEAKWACQGPYSSSCDGPVIAGAADGACSAQQGGLGMFQFDGGNYAQTLARDGEAILTIEGNVEHAVEFLVAMVERHIDGVESDEEALDWLNAIPVEAGDPLFQQWGELLACRYNGRCGSEQQATKYRTATLKLASEFGDDFWSVEELIEPEPGGPMSSGCPR